MQSVGKSHLPGQDQMAKATPLVTVHLPAYRRLLQVVQPLPLMYLWMSIRCPRHCPRVLTHASQCCAEMQACLHPVV